MSEPLTPEEMLRRIADAIPGSCDWGDCDNNALLARFDPERGWLPVCQWHAADARSADLAPITAIPLGEEWATLDATQADRLAREYAALIEKRSGAES